jgi:hypothetical protein
MNPDGVRNPNLNRDFPDVFREPGGGGVSSPQTAEVSAVTAWTARNNFILSLSLISGAKVISIPFDNIPTTGKK